MAERLKHPVDLRRRRHYCQDETAVAMSGRWLCQCPGGPYFTDENLRMAHRSQRIIDETEDTKHGFPISAESLQ